MCALLCELRALTKTWLLGAVLLTASPAHAHHDPGDVTSGEPLVWRAIVTQVSWDGAHVMYRVETRDPDGAGDWQILAASPKRLAKRGVNVRTIRVGDTITVAGYLNPYSKVVSPVYFQNRTGQRYYVGYFTDDRDFPLRNASL